MISLPLNKARFLNNTRFLQATLSGVTMLGLSSGAYANETPKNINAHELFKQVVYHLAQSYQGTTDIPKWGEWRKPYWAELLERCPTAASCDSTEAYELVARMVQSLADNHTNFLSATQYQSFQKSFAPVMITQAIFGARIQRTADHRWIVQEVLPKTAAAQAGWLPGDHLLTLQDAYLSAEFGEDSYAFWSATALPVRYTLSRQGQQLQGMLRAQIAEVNAVDAQYLPSNILYIRIRTFLSPKVAEQVHGFIAKAQENPSTPIKAVVLDVRGNGGGAFDQFMLTTGAFADIADFQVKQKLFTHTYAYREGVALQNKQQLANQLAQPVRYQGPLLVLVDGFSASASEFMAQALKDRPNTVIAGEKTFGLSNTITYMQSLSDSSAVQITLGLVYDAQNRLWPAAVEPSYPVAFSLEKLSETGLDNVLEAGLQKLLQPVMAQNLTPQQ